jgi:hypothetical protein
MAAFADENGTTGARVRVREEIADARPRPVGIRPRCVRPLHRAHAFAKQAAALRRAFYAEVKPGDMRRVVRTLVTEATGGNLQAARLLLLWVLGKPDNPVHPDGIAAMLAAEAQADPVPPPLPAAREADLDFAARELAQEIIALRGLPPIPGGVGVPALEARD